MIKKSQQKILVIDDSKIVLNEMKNILDSFGYISDIAEGGNAGFLKILDIKPDLVLLDVEMPDINGFEVFRRIRARSKYLSLPIIVFFTSKSNKKVEGLKLGASDFISKLLAKEDPDEFNARIHGHLKVAELMRRNIELEKLDIIRATSTSARHEIFQPLTVISVGVHSVLSCKNCIPKCDDCISALKPTKKAIKDITDIVKEFSNINTTETIKYAGGGDMLSRSGKN